jgi:hypothetical protein
MKTARYFEEQVLRKRPYIRREWRAQRGGPDQARGPAGAGGFDTLGAGGPPFPRIANRLHASEVGAPLFAASPPGSRLLAAEGGLSLSFGKGDSLNCAGFSKIAQSRLCPDFLPDFPHPSPISHFAQ